MPDYYYNIYAGDYLEEYIKIVDLPDDYYTSSSIIVTLDSEILKTTYGSIEYVDFYPYSLSKGNHTINIFLPETSKYIAKNLTKTFEINPDLVIDIPQNMTLGSFGGKILIKTTGDEGSVYIYVDGKFVKKMKCTTKPNFFFSLENDIQVGRHNVTVIYNESKHGFKGSLSKIVDVDFGIILYGDTYLYNGWSDFIEVDMPENLKSTPFAKVNDKTFKIVKESGNYYRILINNELKPGKYNLTVTYPGDSLYPKKSVTFNLTVLTRIVLLEGQYSQSKIQLLMPEDGQGNVTVMVDGELYKSIPVEGLREITLSDVPVGKHKIEAYYTGSDYEIDPINQSITIEALVTTSDDFNLLIGKIPIVNIKMNPDANGTWRYEIHDGGDGIPVIRNGTFKTENGEYSIAIPEFEYYSFKEGGFISLQYRDNEFNYWRSFDFYRYSYPYSLVASNVNGYYRDGIKVKINVYDHMKLPLKYGAVKVYFATSKSPTYCIVKNGVTILNMNTYLPKTYKIKLVYELNNQISISKEIKVTIKKILVLNTVKIKKSAKKLVLSAKLLKKLKGKKITFKFNGKAYKAKTNSKGVAKVTIPSKILKKLKVGKKIAYSATYYDSTLKKTAKVKK